MNTSLPITYVLFGATGDLAGRKIMPALASLFIAEKLPAGSSIIASSRRPWDTDEYHRFITPTLSHFSPSEIESFLSQVTYQTVIFNDKESYKQLAQKIGEKESFYHLAVQPEFYASIAQGLSEAGLGGTLLIEKPFGHDLTSAQQLEKELETYFPAKNIWRIDHYLGKTGLKQLEDQRQTNQELEEKIEQGDLESVHVELIEKIDIGDRGEFYDTVGALRDVGQNHLLEMLAVCLAPLPITPTSRTELIASLKIPTKEHISRGQYEGYGNHPDIAPTSQTETYFKIMTESQLPRLANIPIILESGKAFAEKKSAITLNFKDKSTLIFDLENPTQPEAYQTIIEAALGKKENYFVSLEEVLAAWKFITPILTLLPTLPLHSYPKEITTIDF